MENSALKRILEVRGFIEKQTEEEVELLQMMAFMMKDFNMFSIKQFAFNNLIKQICIDKLINKLKKNKFIYNSAENYLYYNDSYILDPFLHIELLIKLSQLSESQLSIYNEIDFSRNFGLYSGYSVKTIEVNRNTLLNFFKNGSNGILESVNSEYVKVNYLIPLLRALYYYEDYKKLLHCLPEELFINLACHVTDRITDLFEWDSISFMDYLFQTNLKYTPRQLDALKDYLLFPKYVFKGDFEAAKINVSGITLFKNFINSLSYFYDGEVEKCIDEFEYALKIMNANTNSRNLLSKYLFIDFVYTCALIKSKNIKAQKKIQALLKCKFLKENDFKYKGVVLLLKLHTQTDWSNIQITLASENLSKLNDLLYYMVICHFHLKDDLTVFTDKIKKLFSEQFSLLYNDLPKEVKDEYKDIDNSKLNTLFTPFKYVDLWEKTLDHFLGDHSTEQSVVQPKADYSRIIYLVKPYFDIVNLKLQKSKDGVNWTKGRNVALSTFKNGIPEMNAFDKQMASLVRQYRGTEYYGYTNDFLELNGTKVFKALAGYPLVFLESEQTIPVDIYIEKPYISINKSKSCFEITTNVENIKDSTAIYINWENDTRVCVIETSKKEREIIQMLVKVKSFPIEASEKLSKVLEILSKDITIHSDLLANGDKVKNIDPNSNIIIQLLPKGDSFKADLYVKPLGNVPPYCNPGTGKTVVIGKLGDDTIQTERNLKKELNNLNSVLSLLDNYDSDQNDSILLSTPSECLDFLDTVYPIENATIEWPEGGEIKLKKSFSLNSFSLSMKSKNNWFEIVGNLDFGGDASLELNDVLNQLHENTYQRFISVGDNEYIALSNDLRNLLLKIDALTQKDKKGNRKISEFAAPVFDSWLDEKVNIKTDKSYKNLISRIDEASKKEYNVPAQLEANLRPYQEDGFFWMARLCDWGSGACLADDMGLGKTIQTLAMLLYRAENGASLVVAPASVLLNWEQEIVKFAPALTCKIMHGASDRKSIIDNLDNYDVVLTTYGLLTSEEELLSSHKWNVVVLDEAHTIKNKETKMSKAAMQLNADFRLLLTGTPVQNHLSEIWNLFQFMNPGMLGSFEQFNSKFIIPIEINNDKEQRNTLKKLVAPFLLRRTKNEVLNELPGKTEIVVSVELSNPEAVVYESLRRKAEKMLENGEMNQIQSLAEITKLRQAASHIKMVDENFNDESSKTAVFLNLVDEMKENNHRALVFSQFTSHLALLKKALDKRNISYLYLDGSTPVLERAKLVKQFQTGTQLLFLISLKAGGLGLNLTAADFIVHLDPWWNPAIEDQASDRAYRIGQKKPVTVYRLIASNTIEEKIIELHKTKKDLADFLLEGTNHSHKLSKEDLLALISLK